MTTCSACGEPAKLTPREVFVLVGGELVPARVCAACEARAIRIVAVSTSRETGAILAPLVERLRGYAKAYALNKDDRAPGLEHAADVLDRAAGGEGPRRRPPALSVAPPVPPAAKPAREVFRSVFDLPPAPIIARSFPPRDDVPDVGEATPMDGKILRALFERGAPMNMRELAIAAGVSPRGGALAQSLRRLVRGGLAEKRAKGIYAITHEGARAADMEPLPTGPALLAHLTEKMSAIESSILNVFVTSYPQSVPRGRMAELSGFEPRGGAFGKALRKLRARGLVTGWRASDELMRKAAEKSPPQKSGAA